MPWHKFQRIVLINLVYPLNRNIIHTLKEGRTMHALVLKASVENANVNEVIFLNTPEVSNLDSIKSGSIISKAPESHTFPH